MAASNLSSPNIPGIGPGISGSLKRKIPTGQDTIPTSSYNAADWSVGSGNYLSASAVGDPHRTTLTGEYYEFDYLGPFRLLECSINNKKLIINGQSEIGPGRWDENQYIKKIYINYNGKDILVDTGFRGIPVNILNNNSIDFIEKLDFDEHAKRYSISGKGIGKKGCY